jgi:hypothetical protein
LEGVGREDHAVPCGFASATRGPTTRDRATWCGPNRPADGRSRRPRRPARWALGAALALIPSTSATAAVTEGPATLDFGLVLGGWGVYADGDAEPSIPDQSLEAWTVPASFDETWSMEEDGAEGVARLFGSSNVTSSLDQLVVHVGITAEVAAWVPAGAPDGATAIAEAFFDEVYLSFEVLEASTLTVESLAGDGGWITVSSMPVDPGFDDVSLGGAFIGVTAGPGESLADEVTLTWRITYTPIPEPGAGLLLLGLPLGRGRSRGRDGERSRQRR